MTHSLRTALGAVVLALVAVVVTAPAAGAGEWSGSDPEGDVDGTRIRAGSGECPRETPVDGTGETTNDITGFRVVHGADDVRVRVDYRDVVPRQALLASVHFLTPDGAWWLAVERSRSRAGELRTRTFFAEEPEWSEPDEDDCFVSGVSVDRRCAVEARISARADRLRAVLPRRCLDHPAWLRAGTEAHRFSGRGPGFVVFDDEWGVRDDTASPFVPLYGPEVAAPDEASTTGRATSPSGVTRELVRDLRGRLPAVRERGR